MIKVTQNGPDDFDVEEVERAERRPLTEPFDLADLLEKMSNPYGDTL